MKEYQTFKQNLSFLKDKKSKSVALSLKNNPPYSAYAQQVQIALVNCNGISNAIQKIMQLSHITNTQKIAEYAQKAVSLKHLVEQELAYVKKIPKSDTKKIILNKINQFNESQFELIQSLEQMPQPAFQTEEEKPRKLWFLNIFKRKSA